MQARSRRSTYECAPQALSNEVGALLLLSAPLKPQTVRAALLRAQHDVDATSHCSWPLPSLALGLVAVRTSQPHHHHLSAMPHAATCQPHREQQPSQPPDAERQPAPRAQ